MPILGSGHVGRAAELARNTMAIQTTERNLTLADAEARLPLIRRIVRDAINLQQQVAETRERLDDMRQRRRGKTHQDIYAEEWTAIEQELEQDAERLNGFVTELGQLGARFVNTEEGIVSFQSMFNGQPILLSWKYDEPQIAYYYDIEQNPTQRRLLESRGRDSNDGPGVNRIESRFDESV
jgi:hypothetical protein